MACQISLESTPRLRNAGSRGLLLDVAMGAFSAQLQQRILALAARMLCHPGVEQTVPGMNNLLLVYRPQEVAEQALAAALLQAWQEAGRSQPTGRLVEIPVVYGGASGEDLSAIAEQAGFSVQTFVELHSAAEYQVACLGAMPGFPYLSGLDSRLATPRRAVPRMRLEQGTVIIGGSQAAVMPFAGPSGWHAIGQTSCLLFDPANEQPALLQPGDRVRFTIAELLP
ncbi:5-oxoprolinase subunit PxpB [Pseudomonas sp. JG-B]|uniref:5-oxoprolinase subunit PxpB n=1 Tax=Pseudomonas sp. JG-B TaxID=2603214 RepID=UPI00129E7A31|nr:5-oxoprolinase subunit PxpB [Pseudomonas sp. JG-B]MRK21926.1 5-oxoprolinase subunit PxpB [Pseudomonas sp. JG-B]